MTEKIDLEQDLENAKYLMRRSEIFANYAIKLIDSYEGLKLKVQRLGTGLSNLISTPQ